MKLAFWKKKESQDEKTAAEDAGIAEETAADEQQVRVQEDEQPVVDKAAMAADIRDLLKRISEETDLGPQEQKLLGSAFSKAAGAVLGDAELATAETVASFAAFAEKVEDVELHGDAISRLGSIAVKYPDHADKAVGILETSLADSDKDVRHAGVFALAEVALSNGNLRDGIVETLLKATESKHSDVRLDAVTGLRSIAVKFEEHAEATVKALSAAITKKPGKDKAQQEYTVRIASARRLGEIALAHDGQVDAVIEALTPGLKDEDLFVKYRSLESLEAIGLKHADKIDDIVERLKKAKDGAQFVVNEKLDRAINKLQPPKKPEKTPEELAIERAAAEARQKEIEENQRQQAEAQRQKTEAENARKSRMDGIKTVANRLPGKALK